jgi:hypothetical protein
MTAPLVRSLGPGSAEECLQLLDDRVLLIDKHQVVGIVDQLHLRSTSDSSTAESYNR